MEEYRELVGDEIPKHLRPDAPTAICNRCGRETVNEADFGQEDRMTQPDGGPCGGLFSYPSKELMTIRNLMVEVSYDNLLTSSLIRDAVSKVVAQIREIPEVKMGTKVVLSTEQDFETNNMKILVEFD